MSIAEARKDAREKLYEWQAGAALPEPVQPEETVRELIERWLKIDQKEKRSANYAGRTIRRVMRAHLDKPASSITHRHIQAIVDDLREKKGPSVRSRGGVRAARHAHSVMHRMFNWALKRRDLDVNPAAAIDVPPPPLARRRTLTDDELRAIWLAVKGGHRAPRLTSPKGRLVIGPSCRASR